MAVGDSNKAGSSQANAANQGPVCTLHHCRLQPQWHDFGDRHYSPCALHVEDQKRLRAPSIKCLPAYNPPA